MKWYSFIQKYFGAFFAAGIALGLGFPDFFMPVSNRVLLILGAVMTLTFLTLDLQAAAANLRRFHHIGAALVLSKAVFPLLMFLAARPLGDTVALGVLLLGLTPFATVSPTLTKIVDGDTEFILICVVLLTLLAPVYLPGLLLLYGGESIELDVLSMMKTLVLLIIIPFGLSLIMRPLLRGVIERTTKYYGAVTILLITLLLTGLLAGASEQILSDPVRALPLGGIAILFGTITAAFGWFGFFFLDRRKRVGLSISNLYMNIGLAAVITAEFFKPEVMLFIMLYELPANMFPSVIGRLYQRGELKRARR